MTSKNTAKRYSRRRVLAPKNRRPANAPNSTRTNHRRSHHTFLLRPRSLILPIRQTRRNIRLRAVHGQKEAHVASTRRPDVHDQEKPDDAGERLADEDGPAHADFVGDVGHAEAADDGEDVRWGLQELGFGVVEAEAVLEDDGFDWTSGK